MKRILLCSFASLVFLGLGCSSDAPTEEQKEEMRQSEVSATTDSLFDEASKVMEEAGNTADSTSEKK